MPITIRHALPHDIPAIAVVLGDALRTSLYLRSRFPHSSREDHLEYERRTQEIWFQDETYKVLLAAVDDPRGEVVGVLAYKLEGLPGSEMETLPEDVKVPGMQEEFGKEGDEAKEKLLELALKQDGPHIQGIRMGVLARMQKLGIATMLADKLREEAEQLHIPLYTDCGDQSLGFCERYAATHGLALTQPLESVYSSNKFGEDVRESFLKFSKGKLANR